MKNHPDPEPARKSSPASLGPPAARPRRASRWLVRGLAAAGLSALAPAVLGLAAVWLLIRDPHPGLEDGMPVSCGARGPDFEIRCLDGMPYLVENGLPYPTGFDSTDHAVLSLDGPWRMRFEDQKRDSSGGMAPVTLAPGILSQGDGSGAPASGPVPESLAVWSQGAWHDEGIPIEVPSTYNAPNGPYRDHQGPVWFARRFRFGPLPPRPGPSGRPGQRVRLGFEGVLLRCRVWLNGELLGDREGGYTPFYFDVSERLRPHGENLLVVRADNRLTYGSLPPRVRPRHNPVWGVYGGIYRSVRLETLPATSIAIARVASYRDGRGSGFAAEILLDGGDGVLSGTLPGSLPGTGGPVASGAEGSEGTDGTGGSQGAGGQLAISVTDPDGKPGPESVHAFRNGVSQVLRVRMPVADPKAWAPGRPHLYAVRMRLQGPGGEETVTVKTGLRELTVEGPSLKLDGRGLFLKGISKMEDDPALGQTQTLEGMRRDLEWIRRMGANYVRLAHYPHHDAEARLARDMGLMVGGEIPYFHVGEGWSQWLVDFQGWGGFPFPHFGMKHLHRKDLLLQAQKSLIELIERDGNNPAVILWSLGNESYNLGDHAGRVYAWLRESARAFDKTRPVTLAEMSYYLPLLDGLRASPRYLDVASVNAYYGWYFGDTAGAEAHMDRFHARYPGKALLLSEFGAEAALGRTDASGYRTGDRVFFPRTYSEAYQAALLSAHVRAAWERPYVLGVSPWVFADFYCPWFPHNPVPYYNNKGVMTRERVPKQGYYELQRLYQWLPDFRDPRPLP
jgi:beta-galactosidase/beta-glucuronidase